MGIFGGMKISTSLLDLTLESVDGIGSVTKKKLIDSGISNPLDLAVATPKEVVEVIGGSVDRAFQFVFNAKKLLVESGLLDREMIPASELLEKRRDMKRMNKTISCRHYQKMVSPFLNCFSNLRSQSWCSVEVSITST
jgi:hypothetical protein